MDPIELEQWLSAHPPALADVIRHVAAACARISRAAARAPLAGQLGGAGSLNSQGEPQQRLDVLADACVSQALSACTHVAGWVSEEHADVTVSPEHGSGGAYLVVFDPLDGSSNVETNVAIGSIFSVLPHLFRGTPASAAAFMQPGRRQVAAGYAIYGPSTVLVLSLGQGVHMFTLDPDAPGDAARWVLTRADVEVPVSTTEFAINASNQRFWEKPVQRYVAECLAGQSGPRGRDFNMRWVASLVAEVHRILTRGGVFLYPRDSREPFRPGRLRLLYEAAPMAWLMEQAGAAATTGTGPLLELVPDALHHKVPVILGSRDEVERIVTYHEDPSANVSWQLFKTRSLFIQPQA
ncbi:fructose-bisphosphatase class I [Methylibium sp. Pch-M]|uniref:Fructose-1,6-bisphosphatase class 1 1 n=3 Tax=Methylibium TaxID=316612 RepID=F16A1_METPP|nr:MULTISPECIES: class 1 fructose-bisphosphatase [Methylibium]A2SFV4.1 RecName: Full=Fructose-1,6-bisphosphatase class 1 1; Short=FBPase class 1 1; AltName: Full=D-fructose-1,6-bisphosphate 1-phosphohydrolase class 1 1 [Methylibium petroleiphilum PM1]ABM94443.1 D-fructose 1,6-bisphosphatase [Methylibium petroleiphilum PM1]QAZ38079.1 fructose-bisphosphatase class I [Methylibium sp. Pch-M]